MRLIKNSGSDRVVDELRQVLVPQGSLDIASPAFSLFAFGEIRDQLSRLAKCRLLVPAGEAGDLSLLGTSSDRAYRNRLQSRWLARQCAAWLEAKAEVKSAPSVIPQATLILGGGDVALARVITGNCPFTTEGLGITPGNQFSLIQVAESAEECALLGAWFAGLWNSLPVSPEAKRRLLARLHELIDHCQPSLIYFLTLYHVFKDLGGELDEEHIVKSATGIRNTNPRRQGFKW